MYIYIYICIICIERERDRQTDRQIDRIFAYYIHIYIYIYTYVVRERERERDKEQRETLSLSVHNFTCKITRMRVRAYSTRNSHTYNVCRTHIRAHPRTTGWTDRARGGLAFIMYICSCMLYVVYIYGYMYVCRIDVRDDGTTVCFFPAAAVGSAWRIHGTGLSGRGEAATRRWAIAMIIVMINSMIINIMAMSCVVVMFTLMFTCSYVGDAAAWSPPPARPLCLSTASTEYL